MHGLSLSPLLPPPTLIHSPMSLTQGTHGSGSSKVIVLTSNLTVCSQAPGQPVCICVCVGIVCAGCVYSLSFFASPNNSPTVINIVWRSLRPAVSGPVAQGSGSDADEWPPTHTHTHTHLVKLQAHSLSSCQAKGQDLLQPHQTALYGVCVCVCSYILLCRHSKCALRAEQDHGGC